MPILRRARRDDADALVQLIVIAGEGLPYYIWDMMKQNDESLHDTGKRRALREEGAFSYKNAWVVSVEDAVVSAMIGYQLPDVVEPIDFAAMPLMFVPFQQLENMVPGSWYINVLATCDDYRCRGFGTRLLTKAESEARRTQAPAMSIVTGDINPALDIYRKFGFVEQARRPIVKDDWNYDGSEWVLLTKTLQ